MEMQPAETRAGRPERGGFSVSELLVLVLSGRWSGVRSSAERLGVAFGWCWIALAVSGEVGAWCLALNY